MDVEVRDRHDDVTVIVPDKSPEEIQTFVGRLHCMSMNSDVSEMRLVRMTVDMTMLLDVMLDKRTLLVLKRMSVG